MQRSLGKLSTVGKEFSVPSAVSAVNFSSSLPPLCASEVIPALSYR